MTLFAWAVVALLIVSGPVIADGALLDELEDEYKRASEPLCPTEPPRAPCAPPTRLAHIKQLAARIETAARETTPEEMWRVNRLRIDTDLLTTRVSGVTYIFAEREAAAAEERRAVAALQRAEAARTERIRARRWPTAVTEAVLARKVSLGMTREQVREAWGEAQRVDETTTAAGTSEWWWYGASAVSFEAGVVKSIHRSSGR